MLDGKNKRTFVLMSSQKSCLESGVPIKAMRFDLWDVEALIPINKCVHSLITYKAFSEIYIKWKYRTGTTLFSKGHRDHNISANNISTLTKIIKRYTENF